MTSFLLGLITGLWLVLLAFALLVYGFAATAVLLWAIERHRIRRAIKNDTI